MEYLVRGKDVLLWQPDFQLAETLDCGQAFRWAPDGDGYSGFRLDIPLTILPERDYFRLVNTTEETFLTVWREYFDLDTDYGELKRLFSQEETLREACAFAGGIRLLKQDPWEALISFLISQNNHIPRIKGIISRLCGVRGHFPSPVELAGFTQEEMDSLRAGFRSKYLLGSAELVSQNQVCLSEISRLPLEEARQALRILPGVGPKVAECVLLYGMYRVDAFPVDVWIKRVLERYYPEGIPHRFLPQAGIAQQYLFHYIRNIPQKSLQLAH